MYLSNPHSKIRGGDVCADSFDDLTSRLKTLEVGSEGAPLLKVVKGAHPPAYERVERLSSMDEGVNCI